jgi:predicted nucleic acid-binding protein
MKSIFADTSFYVALYNRRDSLHALAVAMAGRLTGRIVTSEFVLIEVANFFKRPGDRAAFAAIDATLRSDPSTAVIEASGRLYSEALKLFAARPDQHWSLVDCTSFQIMRELSIAEALTADDDFKQAGFQALLKQNSGV